MQIIIRSENSSDYNQITHVNDQAFEQPNEGRLITQLRALPDFIPDLSLVAEFEGQIIGHILFTISKVKWENDIFEMLCLAPMAVLPEFQKKGIGSKLVQEGLKRARALGYQSVNVLGHKNFYPKFGFRPASHWEIKAPFEVPDDVFMALELVDGALKGQKGVVHYAEPFKEV